MDSHSVRNHLVVVEEVGDRDVHVTKVGARDRYRVRNIHLVLQPSSKVVSTLGGATDAREKKKRERFSALVDDRPKKKNQLLHTWYRWTEM